MTRIARRGTPRAADLQGCERRELLSSTRPALDTGDPRARVLVVEDNEALGRQLTRIIEQCGAAGVLVGTSRAARGQFALLAACRALIIDVTLPDGCGLDLLAHFRVTDASVPALILTGRLERDVTNAAFRLGAEYLAKPVEANLVEKFVHGATSQAGHGLAHSSESMSLARATWLHIHATLAFSPSKAAAARTPGIATRSLRRMLAKDPPKR